MEINDEQLAALELLLTKATPAPWVRGNSHAPIMGPPTKFTKKGNGVLKPVAGSEHPVIKQDNWAACGDPDCCTDSPYIDISEEDIEAIITLRNMGNDLVAELRRLRTINQNPADIKKARSNKTIECACCKQLHRIGDLDAIETHWYVQPSGCSDGDYWLDSDWHFVCPISKVRNRLLFHESYWTKDKKVDPQLSFKELYRGTFKSMTPEFDDQRNYAWLNNSYVDENRAVFELPVGSRGDKDAE